MILVESIHGSLREFVIAPLIGESLARQLSFFTGSFLILTLASLTAPWLNATTRQHQLQVGVLWMVLMFLFEVGLGLARSFSWERINSEYNPAKGGFMLIGMIILLLAPVIGAWLRSRRWHFTNH